MSSRRRFFGSLLSTAAGAVAAVTNKNVNNNETVQLITGYDLQNKTVTVETMPLREVQRFRATLLHQSRQMDAMQEKLEEQGKELELRHKLALTPKVIAETEDTLAGARWPSDE